METQVALEIGDEARSVGVVGEDARLPLHEEIRSARTACPCALLGRELQGIGLERQRNARAAASGLEEGAHASQEISALDEQSRVVERFAGLACKQGMDGRRKAVRDGVSDDDVAVHAKRP